MAHPFKQLGKARQLKEFVEIGIDGIEVQPNYGDRNNQFREFAEERGLLITYGSDYHGARFIHRPLLHRNGNGIEEIALPGFEPGSQPPEGRILGRCTIGLQYFEFRNVFIPFCFR